MPKAAVSVQFVPGMRFFVYDFALWRRQLSGIAYSPKSNTRNRIPGTSCTEIAASCIGLRGASQYWKARSTVVILYGSTGHLIAKAAQARPRMHFRTEKGVMHCRNQTQTATSQESGVKGFIWTGLTWTPTRRTATQTAASASVQRRNAPTL
eukprot:2205957-Rhodomonas_salina.2